MHGDDVEAVVELPADLQRQRQAQADRRWRRCRWAPMPTKPAIRNRTKQNRLRIAGDHECRPSSATITVAGQAGADEERRR